VARPLDKRPVGETEKNTWTTFARVARDPLPHDPERLRRIVEALLSRFERRNPREARSLLSHIHWLAGTERRFPLHSAEEHATASAPRQRLLKKADRLAKELLQSADEEVLDILRHAGVPRSNHAADTLRFQRDLLSEFLRIQPYPMIRTTRDEALKGWMRKNASRIWEVLSKLPCYCTYRESYHGLLEGDLSNCLGPAPLIELILAELHRSTRSAIRKVLSHPNTR
jgi:hypothetical protein